MKKKIKQSETILNTAFKCLSFSGYANVSMRDIAKESGVALSQLNYYYNNKEGLFTEVIKVMAEQYIGEIERLLKSKGNSKEKLSRLKDYFKSVIKEKPELLRLFIDFSAQALWIKAFREQLMELNKKLSEIIEIHIIRSSEDTRSIKYSAKSLSRLLLGALFGTSLQVLLEQEEVIIDSIDLVKVVFE